LVKHSYSAN